MSVVAITEELLKVAEAQLSTTPSDTDIMTLAFTLVPRIEALAKGQLKGSEKMELLLSVLDAALNKCAPEVAGPLRVSLRDKIIPSVSGLINATKTGDIALGVSAAVTIGAEVVAVAKGGCFCFGKKAAVPHPAEAKPVELPTTLPPLPESPTA